MSNQIASMSGNRQNTERDHNGNVILPDIYIETCQCIQNVV